MTRQPPAIFRDDPSAVAAIDDLFGEMRDDVCTVQRQSAAVDPGGAPTVQFDAIATLDCRVKAGTAAETTAAGRLGPVYDYEIRVNRQADVRAGDRIVIDGRAFSVGRVLDALSSMWELRVFANSL